MKTIREWLEELPEPYRSEALKNADKDKLDAMEDLLSHAIAEAFDWEDSPQGFDYWNNQYLINYKHIEL